MISAMEVVSEYLFIQIYVTFISVRQSIGHGCLLVAGLSKEFITHYIWTIETRSNIMC